MKIKRIAILALIVLWMITAIIAIKSSKKLTYIEYQYENEIADDYIELKNSGEYLEQRFASPYDILNGVSINIDTFSRDNNSVWNISLIDGQNGNILYSKYYNASLIEDDSFHLFEFDKNIKVEKNYEYIIRVQAVDVNDNTSLSFFVGPNSDLTGVVNNGTEISDALCFAIYGGDFDIWWIGYAILISLFISITIIRVAIVYSKGARPFDDRLLGGMIVTLIVLVILYPFSIPEGFMDEWDNMRGGMIIARGGVLYRDYVTQHTPVMYYLCGLFAVLGAGSVQQFRLSYYLFEAVVWGAVYVRHSDYFGKKKIIALALVENVFVTILGSSCGYLIISDNMQGLCSVILLLEFMRYYHDRKLDWYRSIIVSISIWGSIGSAFISVYSIIFICISVIGVEISWIIKDRPGVKHAIKRYSVLISCIIIPLICAIVYFKVNNSLKLAFDQFYRFNREVYPVYVSTGDNLIALFIIAIKNHFAIIGGTIDAILSASVTSESVLQLVIVALATVTVVDLCREKQFVVGITIFALMVFSGTRGNGFHGIPEWYVALAIIVLCGYGIISKFVRKVTIPVSVIIGIYLLTSYIQTAGSNLLEEQGTITDLESRIVSVTDDNEGIFIDTCCCDSLYLCYKNRYPVNSATYMGLAWYMDWYEQDTIDDLCIKKPRIVIFNPDEGFWCNAFKNELMKDYIQFSNDSNEDWQYKVWIRTN